MDQSALGALFAPSSIAIIGASNTPKSVGNYLVKNLIASTFAGQLHPINPHDTTVEGLPTVDHISKVATSIDLAVIAVPAPMVPTVLTEAIDTGIKAAIVISSGFKERDDEGKKLELEVKNIAQSAGIALLGPNSLGLINTWANMNASFAQTYPQQGTIAVVSQSGAICTALLDYAQGKHIGLSMCVSVGNKTSLGEREIFSYLAHDPHTNVIVCYVESLENAQGFIETCRSIVHGPNAKPILIMKGGRSEQGMKASSSHTGALAGSYVTYTSLFAQAGIFHVQDFEQVFDIAVAFAQNPKSTGPNTVVVSDAGGPAILATDTATDKGLVLPPLSEETIEKLAAVLPTGAGLHNPIDVLGDAPAKRYQDALSIIKSDKNFDNAIVILSPQATTEVPETAQAIVNEWKGVEKPIIANFMGLNAVQPGIDILEKAGIATTIFPEAAARSMAALWKFSKLASKTTTEEPYPDLQIDKSIAQSVIGNLTGKKMLSTEDCFTVLSAYGIPTVKHKLVHSADEAIHVARTMGSSLALKIQSPDITHKTDVGGVVLHVKPDEAGRAYQTIVQNVSLQAPKATVEGVLVTEMAPPGGVECVVGIKREEPLGSMVMFGLGGIYVELLKDVAFRFAPLTQEDAEELISTTKAGTLFDGFRGQQPLDRKATLDVLLRISLLIQNEPSIAELDINPLWVQGEGKGVIAVDARVTLQSL